MTDVLFVLGMHRSGTSALTRVLSLCGGQTPPDLIAAAADNPRGYWESGKVVDINSRFLAANSISTIDPCLIARLAETGTKSRKKFRSSIAKFLKALKGERPVVLKDPRFCLLFSDWRDVALELGLSARAVHIFRNQYEVADSLAARDKLTPALSLALWVNYNLVAERGSRGLPRLFVSFEELLSRWESVVRRCISAISGRLGITEESRTAVGAFIAPDLRHHEGGRVLGCPLIEQRARTVYKLLQDACHGKYGPSKFDAEFKIVSELSPQLAEEAARRGFEGAKVLREEVRRLKDSASLAEERLTRAERFVKRKKTNILA